MKARTQVGIIGAGPAGLMLCHLLRLRGIDSVVLEARSRRYVEERVRAGVLEHGVVETLREAGLADRLDREGLRHEGIAIRFNGRSHRIDFTELTGKAVTVYGQQEVVKDLIAAALAAGTPIEFDVMDVTMHGIDGDKTPSSATLRYRDANDTVRELTCDYIAGCDGFHGISRPGFPAGVIRSFERDYPFAWLGILAQSPPPSHELIYVHHDRGFALFSMRTPQVTRMYLQCAPDEDIANWPDERIWTELRRRLEGDDAPALEVGPILQKGITPMRSFVAEPMRHGRLFLAGDAAHIVPPTGAKGMNLAIADVRVLAKALDALYKQGDAAQLDRYSDTCLRRVWKAERFSWWMTSLLHRFHAQSPFDYRVQVADLDYLTGSRAASTALAENYVGLPFEDS